MHTLCNEYTNGYSTHCTTVQTIQDFPKNVLTNIQTNCVCKTLKYFPINAEFQISSLPIEVPHYTNNYMYKKSICICNFKELYDCNPTVCYKFYISAIVRCLTLNDNI